MCQVKQKVTIGHLCKSRLLKCVLVHLSLIYSTSKVDTNTLTSIEKLIYSYYTHNLDEPSSVITVLAVLPLVI